MRAETAVWDPNVLFMAETRVPRGWAAGAVGLEWRDYQTEDLPAGGRTFESWDGMRSARMTHERRRLLVASSSAGHFLVSGWTRLPDRRLSDDAACQIECTRPITTGRCRSCHNAVARVSAC